MPKSKFIQYLHHGRFAWVNVDLVGQHRDHCLCYSCGHFIPGTTSNCPIAEAVYENCVLHGLVTPVYECPQFEEGSADLPVEFAPGGVDLVIGIQDGPNEPVIKVGHHAHMKEEQKIHSLFFENTKMDYVPVWITFQNYDAVQSVIDELETIKMLMIIGDGK